MDITLDHIMPTPLKSIEHGSDSIWGNHVKLEDGKRILLNASSGKGKTTFLTTAYGLRKDYTGEIRYGDENITDFTPDRWTEIRMNEVSVVFQDLQLFQKLSVGENLLLKNSLTDIYTESELKTLLGELEIEHKWDQKCGLLSMGQQQRVAIIRALAQPYTWLIMDEPYSHLDVDNAKRCMNLIHERTIAQNAGFVLTTLGDSHGYKYDQELKL
ncbi:MAG: ATP-binding cassette domain-containing protein [Crocinitomicaceae bacterium]|nr:ATP-binding cassette domain-containing protein [Crocinitomicaceae bacterium]MDG1657861.1 ATP-binding cassette domain-containing protein [Crocinitomicaceae bacterium]